MRGSTLGCSFPMRSMCANLSVGKSRTFLTGFDEDIYKVEVPEGKDAKAESKKKKKEVGSENRRSKEDKPRITIDVLTMLQEEEKMLQGTTGSAGKRCPGCGVLMQTTDPVGIGYRPPQMLGVEADGGEAICQRCHYLRYQNKVIPIKIAYSQLKEHLAVIKTLKVLVVKIVDLFDFSGSWIDNFRDIIGTNPVVLVANKVDLLPAGLGRETTKAWLRKAVDELNLKNVKAIHLISAKTGKGVPHFAEKLEQLRKGRDVYVMGCTNVGKSTLINRLLLQTKGPKHRLITTSSIPGTTLNLISFPIGARRKHKRQASLYDTPGVVNDHQMVHHLTPEELKVAMPSKVVKPNIIRIVPGKTLFFGGLARLDYVEGPSVLLATLFLSHQLPVHPTSSSKADALYSEKVGVLPDLMPPNGKERALQMPPFVMKEVKLDASATHFKQAFKDIVFGGLGWVSLTGPANLGKTVTLRVGSPAGVGIFLREPLMPFEASFQKNKKQELRIRKHGTFRSPDGSSRNREAAEGKDEEEVDTQEEPVKRKVPSSPQEERKRPTKADARRRAALELLALEDEGHGEEEAATKEVGQQRDEKQLLPAGTEAVRKKHRWKRTKWWLEKGKRKREKAATEEVV